MKTRLAVLLCLALTVASRADEPAAPAVATDSVMLTAEQLEQLVGPIALYPDALIAIILPASTAPADIVLAARYLKDDGDPAAVGSRSWDESVKSLTNYAAVVKWMDENLAWTKQLGEAFRDQPAEVMQAIQRLRTKARAAGTLTDSPQQQVLLDNELIMIVPAQANYLYVPYYDPLVVFAPQRQYYGTTFITYSSPFAVGSWLRFDCDWRARTVWTVDRHWSARDRHDWRRPVFPGQPGYVHDPNRRPWRPPSNASRATVVTTTHNNNYRRTDPRTEISRPAPIDRPSRPGNVTRDDSTDRRNDSGNRPQRNTTPTRDPNFVGPVAAPSSASFASTAPAPAPQSNRRYDSGRPRNDSNVNAANNPQPNRTISFQSPPSSRPTQSNPAPVISMPLHQPQPTNYSSGPAPSSRAAATFVGPVAAPAAQRAASNPSPRIRMPAATPDPTPAPATAAPAPSSDERRRDRNENERGRTQQQPE